MSEGAFERVGEEAATKTTGDDPMEAEGKQQQANTDGVEQDDTEPDSFPPE